MPGAMLDCAICDVRKWQDLESAQEEYLRMAGAARLFCDSCDRETYWIYSQHGRGGPKRAARDLSSSTAVSNGELGAAAEVARDSAAYGPMPALQNERRMGEDRRQCMRRSQRRVALQIPVRLRVNSAAAQFEEITHTVNVSRHGIYIQSDRPYEKGAPLYVAMNYSPQEPAQTPEQQATVVRVDGPAGGPTRGVAIKLG